MLARIHVANVFRTATKNKKLLALACPGRPALPCPVTKNKKLANVFRTATKNKKLLALPYPGRPTPPCPSRPTPPCPALPCL
jgi:hypothetical protein